MFSGLFFRKQKCTKVFQGQEDIKDTHREKHPKIKVQRLQKIRISSLGRWYIKLTFLRGSKTGKYFSKQ